MLILALDTSTRLGSVAFLRDGQVLDEISSGDDPPYSTRLFRDLSVLRSRAQFHMKDIDVFAIGAGPGSFTGLRVGLTAVKAWAEVYRRPVAAISGLQAITAQAEELEGARVDVLAPYLDARRGQVFGAIYRRVASGRAVVELIGEEATFSPEEFLSLLKATLDPAHSLLVSPTPDVLPGALVDSMLPGVRIKEVSAVLAPVIGRLAFERASSGQLGDSLALDANYVRRSDAEVLWKGG